MPSPETVAIWLNYNSSRILNIVLESLKSIADLDYDDYLLLVIDNGSTDGSIEKIKQLIVQNPELRKRTKVLELSHNLGFTGAHNIAWRYILAKYPNTKYLALVNNDAILYRESLRTSIEFIKSMPRTCGVQGIIEVRNTGLVDSFGAFIDELLSVHPFMWLRKVEEIPRKCFAVTYVSGAYAVYRMEALKTIALRNGDLFPTHAFAYYDDDLLGILAYINDFNMVAIPIRAAKHYVSLTFRISGTRENLGLRSYVAKTVLYSVRFRPIAILHSLKSVLRKTCLVITKDLEAAKAITQSGVDGIRLAKVLKQKYGLELRCEVIRKIPFLSVDLMRAIIALASYKPIATQLIEYLEHIVAQKYGFRCI